MVDNGLNVPSVISLPIPAIPVDDPGIEVIKIGNFVLHLGFTASFIKFQLNK